MPLRYLISRLSSLGDVVCSLPAASALKKGHPDAHVTWVVDSRFADVVKCCRAVDEVLVRERGKTQKPDIEPYDAALDLQGLLKSALVLGATRAKEKVGYHWQREGSALFSRRVAPDPTSVHVVDQYVDVARAVGGAADRADFALQPSQEALGRMQVVIRAWRHAIAGVGPERPRQGKRVLPQEERFVVVNPGAAWAAKRWPAEHFATLIDGLAAPAVLIGAKGEGSASEVVARCASQPLDLTGQTNLGELIALISLATAHVGGDTGSTHIAAALDIPAIGLYAATRPQRSCPYGQIGRCHYEPLGLGRIRPQDVLNTVEEAIS